MANSKQRSMLRGKGLRATPGRIALLRELESAGKPLSVEELRIRVAPIDLVTVYRTIESLMKIGLAREVRFKDSTMRYEFNDGSHHHHLVCSQCGIIDELPECSFATLDEDILKKAPHFTSVDEHALEFFGTCLSCAQ